MSSDKPKFKTSKLQKSFAVLIVACVAIIFFAGFDNVRAKARDTKRQSDAQDILRGLELYAARHNGLYPEVTDFDYGGWDTTIEPDNTQPRFVEGLVREGILSGYPADPVNNEVYFYRYQKFEAGDFGCTQPFIVFQIFNFEATHEDHGAAACPERDFGQEVPNGFSIQRFE